MADESNTNYEETVGKALAGLVDAARPVEERYAELLALDKNHFVRDSRLPAACVMDIWASDKVSESWKRNTLKRMMHRNSFHGVMFVPLDLEFIERRRPGTVASFSDRFGNNALMYTFGAMVESNSYCIHSPTRKHEHRDDERHCEWCGSTSNGSGCIHSPAGKHEK